MKKPVKSTSEVPEFYTGRRRPITDGTAQPRPGGQIFSYHSQRSGSLQNIGRQEVVGAKSSQTIKLDWLSKHRVVAILCTLALVSGLGYVLSLQPQARIVLLQDKTTKYFLQSEVTYAEQADQILGQSIFNRSKLTADTTRIRLSLLQQHPEIRNVIVKMPVVAHQPVIYIEPYKPSFILTTNSSNGFLLDTTGRALVNISQIPDIAKLELATVHDKSGQTVVLGTRALPSTTVSFISTILAAMKTQNIPVSSLTLPAAAYELDVGVTGKPYFVKYSLESDARQQAGAYLAVRQRLEKEATVPASYIDVRVPERAYYK